MFSLSLGFCNLLRLLPRLASGSAVKRVGEGGAGVGALWQWDSRDTDGGPRVAEQHPPAPEWELRSDGRRLQRALRKLEALQGAGGADRAGRERAGGGEEE